MTIGGRRSRIVILAAFTLIQAWPTTLALRPPRLSGAVATERVRCVARNIYAGDDFGRGHQARYSRLRRLDGRQRLEHRRIVVAFARTVYALRDQPFLERRFRRAFEGIRAKGTVKPAFEILLVQNDGHAVVIGLHPLVSPAHDDRA
jgi:hypothetical protein